MIISACSSHHLASWGQEEQASSPAAVAGSTDLEITRAQHLCCQKGCLNSKQVNVKKLLTPHRARCMLLTVGTQEELRIGNSAA